MTRRRTKAREPRPTGRESVGFRRRREKRRKIELALAGRPLVAGLDLGSRTHAVWLTGRDLDPVEHFRIDHSLEGVAKFVKRAETAREQGRFDRLLVFMETTGQIWRNVSAALEERGLACRTISPLAVDRKREIEHLTYAKGDFRDAELIARLGIEGHWLGRTLETEPVWIELAALAREHEVLLELEVRERLRRRSLLELALPEFLDIFKDPCLKTASALLRALSSPAVTTVDEVLDRARSLAQSKGLHRKKVARLVSLLEAGPSFGVTRMLRAAFLRVGLSAERFDVLGHQRTVVRRQLVELYQRTPYATFLDTIPGVDPANHALVLGFVGDPAVYDRATCLVKLAGIEPRENHSDESEGSHAISRRGLPQLRHVLFRIVSSLSKANDEFSAYVERLGSRSSNPLAYHQAIVAAANKYLRVVHRLCTRKETYNAAKVVPSNESKK